MPFIPCHAIYRARLLTVSTSESTLRQWGVMKRPAWLRATCRTLGEHWDQQHDGRPGCNRIDHEAKPEDRPIPPHALTHLRTTLPSQVFLRVGAFAGNDRLNRGDKFQAWVSYHDMYTAHRPPPTAHRPPPSEPPPSKSLPPPPPTVQQRHRRQQQYAPPLPSPKLPTTTAAATGTATTL